MAQQIKDRLQALFSEYSGKDDAAFSLSIKDEINRYHMELLGTPVKACTCKNRYGDALVELYIKAKNMEQKYILKRGAVFHIGNEYYSRVNLTDDIAAKYLAEHPDATDKFEQIPAAAEQEPAPKPATKRKSAKK